MSNLQLLLQGFSVALSLQNLGAAVFGAMLGLIVGAMPGIGSLAGVALLLPLTYKFNPTTAIIMLGSLYYSNMFGGAFSAILINIPGDGPAVMTTLDGFPMAQKGRPGQALFTSNVSSFIGGLIGMIIVTFTGPTLARLGLNFGPIEMAALLLVALTSIGWLLGDNPLKGIASTALGILIACIGMDAVTGTPRYYFGNIYLMGGIPFVPMVIGIVGFSRVIGLMTDRKSAPPITSRLHYRDCMLTVHDIRRLLLPAIRSGFLGTFVGILPGAGATTGAFMGYAVQKRFKSEEPLGTGAIEGIAACESANNAAAAGAFAPLLALGIPGSGTGAVLLGGLMMWGLNPGPMLFTTHPDFTWGLIASLFLANIITLAIAFIIIPILVQILTVPISLMIPVIATICVVGSYSTTNSMYGVLIMFLAGVLGHIMNKLKYPTAPLVLAIVLSKIFEVNLRRSFLISGGSPFIFFQKPISCVLMIIFMIFILVPVYKAIRRRMSLKKGENI
jgi:putative tricarboxylic transport membrane protein